MTPLINFKVTKALSAVAAAERGDAFREASQFFAGLLDGLFLGGAISQTEFLQWRDALYDEAWKDDTVTLVKEGADHVVR